MDITVNRRQFLTRTVAASAACGIAGRSTSADASVKSSAGEAKSLIDTHVYFGHWPHARLASEEPRELIQLLRQNHVTQAWVGSFDGLFHKDIAAANMRLAESCSKHGDGMLVPFGTVNPTLPDWEDDLRRCHEKHAMPGVRLHPGYHSYALSDPRFTQLLARAADAKLVVQLVVWLADAKHRWLVPAADCADLRPPSAAGVPDRQSSPATSTRLMILGSRADEILPWKATFPQASVSFDFSRHSATGRQSFQDALRSSEHIVFGSGAPLRAFLPLITFLAVSGSTEDRRQAIERELAAKIISRP